MEEIGICRVLSVVDHSGNLGLYLVSFLFSESSYSFLLQATTILSACMSCRWTLNSLTPASSQTLPRLRCLSIYLIPRAQVRTTQMRGGDGGLPSRNATTILCDHCLFQNIREGISLTGQPWIRKIILGRQSCPSWPPASHFPKVRRCRLESLERHQWTMLLRKSVRSEAGGRCVSNKLCGKCNEMTFHHRRCRGHPPYQRPPRGGRQCRVEDY